MESDDANKSILDLREERNKLETLYKNSGSRLPDRGANLRRRILSLEELISTKRIERSKRTTYLTNGMPGNMLGCPRENYGEETEWSEGVYVCAGDGNGKVLTEVEHRSLERPLPKRPMRHSARMESKKAKVEVVELLSDSDTERETSLSVPTASSPKSPNLQQLLANERVVYPVKGGKGCVQIVGSDLTRLEPTEFLNDTCIDLHIKRIEEQCPNMDRCYIFRSYFYTKLIEAEGYAGDNCRKWTKDVNIFDYDYLFVPIYDYAHWSLAVICFAKAVNERPLDYRPCILHLDSVDAFAGHSTSHIGTVLRSYLQAEWDRKAMIPPQRFHSRNLPVKRIAEIPMQQNCADCGLFLLAFLEHFVFNLPDKLDHRNLKQLQTPDRPNFLSSKWLDAGNVGLLRLELLHFMYQIYLEQLPAEHPAFDLLFQKLSRYDADPSPRYKSAMVVKSKDRS